MEFNKKVTKICPYCGEVISMKAIRCNSCKKYVVPVRYRKRKVFRWLFAMAGFIVGCGLHPTDAGEPESMVTGILGFFIGFVMGGIIDSLKRAKVEVLSQNSSVSKGGRQMKKKTTAGILAILLGGLGIHKFYLGTWGWGIIYILFVWTYVPAIVALIEGITILTMPEGRFNEKYNSREVRPFDW